MVDKVSILIPCYNSREYIGSAISSALSQTHENLEVIVFDDGSTDESMSEIIRFESDPRFQWRRGPNRGANVARNILLQMAEGNYVQWLDADDELKPNKIEEQLALFSEQIDLVFCTYETMGPKVDTQCYSTLSPITREKVLPFFISNAVITMLPLHRRDDLLAVGGFNEALPCCQEYELHLRLARNRWKKAIFLNEPLCRKRPLKTSISANERKVYRVMADVLWNLYASDCESGALNKECISKISERLYTCGRHLVREDDIEGARLAFRRFEKLGVMDAQHQKGLLKIIANCIGPINAELFRSFLLGILPKCNR